MKKYWIVSLIISISFVSEFTLAQMNQVPFFDKKGNVRLQTTELDALADTIAIINHRADDVVWSRVVYRVIDMRIKQNYQLYFPVRPTDEYRSLFRIMLDGIVDKEKPLAVYKKNDRGIIPSFSDSMILSGEELSARFAYDNTPENNLIQVNPVTKQMSLGLDQYQKYIKNQFKYLIQEIIFFDKHTSRMYSKIMAIAPLYALHPDNVDSKDSFKFFQESVLCWFSFDELRPYLAKQYVIPNGNDSQRLTFDEYFSQKLFSSYLLGDSNMFNRMLLEYTIDPARIKKEQQRIETELLNYEQDLWEY